MKQHNYNLEKLILGTILYHGQTYNFRKDLSPYDFEDPRNQAIFEVICELEDENNPINCETVITRLQTRLGIRPKIDYLKRLTKHKLKIDFLLDKTTPNTPKYFHNRIKRHRSF